MFIWKKEFELGIKTIDDQHKKLFDLGNKINDLLLNHDTGDDDFDEIYEVIQELQAYTIYHFDTEEELFIKYEYPRYDEHKKEHDNFISFLNSVSPEDIDENQSAFLNKLLEQIVQWVFNHIISSDYMYKDYLLNLGVK